LPVYSKLADTADVPQEIVDRLPKDWRLSQHQLATYRALRSDDVDVVINTAMTGDGKSLAGLLPLLVNPRHNGTLSLFPTNELIQDQYASAGRMLPLWNHPAEWVGPLYGARLDELSATVEVLKRPDLLLRELNNHRLTLSNPDILHAILQFHYQQRGRSPDHVAGQMAMLFDQLTFDEFHIFDTPEVVAVLTGLLFLATQSPRLKTLFLSATPSPQIDDLLKRAGFASRLRMIDPQREGWYHHGADPGSGWRAILQGSNISFAQGNAEDWIAAGGDQILLNWFREHRPGARAALIVNSVATALRLVSRLKPLLAHKGLTVEPNTGITSRTIRKASYDADLLIGTSTVDVGVDFRINLLIFESSGAGTFLQRLGRLGRHTTFTDRDQREQRFAAFAAHALVPSFIYERLFQPQEGEPAPFVDGATYTREDLARIINTAFPKPVSFTHYTRLWGRFVPAKVYQELSRKELRQIFGSVRDHLKQRFYDLTSTSVVKACKEWEERDKQGEGLLIREAQSFRGGSPFDCGVLKEDEGDVVTYDLFWLLANAHLELMTREAFCAAVRRMGKLDMPYQRGYQKFFFRWLGLREQREQVHIILGPQVAQWGSERHQIAQVLPGIQVGCNGHEAFMHKLNSKLIDDPCVGLIIPAHEPRQVQRARYLPPGLQLWPYTADSLDAGVQAGSVAFGRNALLLDSLLRIKPLPSSSDAPMIF
ncbi:type I-D CRISPR-associated helicase Cas3', partial [Oscillochloris sp. ZM17-4]|uniref:type I-D CRISPR-associated helicase Cas3' n=1 Tax=Oscillochloris sp. ZM17-4 TaxID=2866714 RepID=UPI001C73476F